MKEFKNISSKLSKIKKEIPFGTPDKYFDNFSVRLQMKLEEEKKVVPSNRNIVIRFLKPAIGLAASFALIFMLVYWPINKFMANKVADSSLNETGLSEMEYLSIIEGIDENSFYALLEDPNNAENFADDDLANYLVANLSEYEIYDETDN